MKDILIKILKTILVFIFFWLGIIVFLNAYDELRYHIENTDTIDMIKTILTIYFVKLWVIVLVSLWVVLRVFYKIFRNKKYKLLILLVFSVLQIVVVVYQWMFLNFYLKEYDVYTMIYDVIYPIVGDLLLLFSVNIILFLIGCVVLLVRRKKLKVKR